MSNPVPIPKNDKWVNTHDWEKYPKTDDKDPSEGKLTKPAIDWLTSIGETTNNAPAPYSPASYTGQNDSIGATPVTNTPLSSGLYRLTYYCRVTSPASVSSSLTVGFSWIDGGVTCSVSGTPVTGNTTDTTGSQTYMVRIDGGTPITFSTTYASNAANEMVYSLDVFLELLVS